jgi:tRNA(Ile)-lysidine synthase
MDPAARALDDWSARWPTLSRSLGLRPDEPLLLAFSGGADSTLLLHWLSAAMPAADVLAVHVDHGLRGAESHADAEACRERCRALGVPFRAVRLALDPRPEGLEARAREARYRALVRAAREPGHSTRVVLTGHHSDDALETLLQRWTRGTDLAGLRGPRVELHWNIADEPEAAPVRILRPLLALRREEVRSLLAARGITWREDRSNADRHFTRSRIRHDLLPWLGEVGGPGVVDDLRAFGQAVEELEQDLARSTAHLAWRPSSSALATRGPRDRALGGELERGALMALARPLARRALWRLLTEGTGAAPSRPLLERVLGDLVTGRCARHSLARGWSLLLRARTLVLVPPRGRRTAAASDSHQPWLPFPSSGPKLLPPPGVELPVPGIVTLEDGRRLSAEWTEPPTGAPVPRGRGCVELEAAELPQRLLVRWPAPGDRFQALGAPGTKSLSRYLAARGIPREERAHVPLVLAGDELLWVAGLAPSERRRVRPSTRRRLRLALHDGVSPA